MLWQFLFSINKFFYWLEIAFDGVPPFLFFITIYAPSTHINIPILIITNISNMEPVLGNEVNEIFLVSVDKLLLSAGLVTGFGTEITEVSVGFVGILFPVPGNVFSLLDYLGYTISILTGLISIEILRAE